MSLVDACAASGGFVPLLLAVLVRKLRIRGTQLRNRMPLGDWTTIAGGLLLLLMLANLSSATWPAARRLRRSAAPSLPRSMTVNYKHWL